MRALKSAKAVNGFCKTSSGERVELLSTYKPAILSRLFTSVIVAMDKLLLSLITWALQKLSEK